MNEEPKMPSAEDQVKIDKSRREAAKDLIDMSAEFTIGAVGKEVEEKLKREKAGDWTPDLGSWIRLRKIILCPVAELNEATAKMFKKSVGHYIIKYKEIWFVDTDGNLASAPIPAPSEVGVFDTYDEYALRTSEMVGHMFETDLNKRLTDLAFAIDYQMISVFSDVSRQHREKLSRRRRAGQKILSTFSQCDQALRYAERF